MNKINLHAHSRFSDGVNTISEMATMYKEMGFCCAVITDHVYRYSDDRPTDPCSLNTVKFAKACQEAETISHALNFPVFLGAEFSIGYGEEILVFGTQAVEFLLAVRDIRGEVGYKDLREARKLFNSAAIMAHPMHPSIFIYEDTIDGFELYNSGVHMFSSRPIPKNLSNLSPWGNSDAHVDYAIAGGYNWIEQEIKCEIDLINLIKYSAPVKIYANKWETV